MDRKMIIAIFLALIIVSAGALLVLSDYGGETAGPVTLIDAAGRNVTTAEAPVRIVSCSPSLTEIVYALGIGDCLVAVTDYCDWPEDVNVRKGNGSLTSVGGYYTPSVEAVTGADGNLILIDMGVQAQMDMVPQLENLEQNVIVLDKGKDFEEVFSNIAMIGEICWMKKEAEQLIDSMKDRLVDIQEMIGTEEAEPTLAFAVWLEPIYLSGNGTFTQDVIGNAQGENVYSDMTGWPQVSVESLLERDPDFLLVSMMYLATPGEDIIQSLQNDTVWSELSAVKNDRVYIFTGQADNVFCRPGPRMIDGVELMAKILHGGSFNVTMPHVIANDYVDWVSESAPFEAPAESSLTCSIFSEGVLTRRK